MTSSGCRIVAAILLTSPLYAASLDPAAVRPRQAPELRFASGVFRPDHAAPRPPGWYRDVSEKESRRGRRYLVAIASGPLDPDQRLTMEKAGASILGYVPNHGYRVRMDPISEDAVRSLPFLAWLGEPPEGARRALAALEALSTPSGKGLAWRLQTTVPPERLGAVLSRLAGLPEVEAIEIARPFRPMNQDGVSMPRA